MGGFCVFWYKLIACTYLSKMIFMLSYSTIV